MGLTHTNPLFLSCAIFHFPDFTEPPPTTLSILSFFLPNVQHLRTNQSWVPFTLDSVFPTVIVYFQLRSVHTILTSVQICWSLTRLTNHSISIYLNKGSYMKPRSHWDKSHRKILLQVVFSNGIYLTLLNVIRNRSWTKRRTEGRNWNSLLIGRNKQ